MKRSQVVQSILDLFREPAYLEVGVSKGETFLPLKAKSKDAVDPAFRFDIGAAARDHADSSFHRMTSNAFFAQLPRDMVYDVIYLDGLHTFEQILIDFLNATRHLKKNGVIIIDDVLPPSYHASLPDMNVANRIREELHPRLFDKSWMGDVYRIVWFLANFEQQYRYATVADNHGQLVVWRETRAEAELGSLSVESVSRLPFEATLLQRDVYRRRPMEEILADLRTYLTVQKA